MARVCRTGCGRVAGCCHVTYDVLRSVPFFTFLWAGGAIYASNMAVRNVEQVRPCFTQANTAKYVVP